MKWEEVVDKAANEGGKVWKTIKKLLGDKRFDKDCPKK